MTIIKAFLLVLAVSWCLSASERARAQAPTSLRWRAELAKKQGLSKITIGAPPEGESIRPLKDLIRKSLIVDGEVESSTVDTSNGFQIFTWCLVRVITKGPTPEWKGIFHSGNRPETLKAPGKGEILIRLFGGTALIDGVTITEIGEPQLTPYKRYLFFLEPLSDDSFVLAHQSVPLDLDSQGYIAHTAKSGFVHRFDKFRSIQDLLDYSEK